MLNPKAGKISVVMSWKVYIGDQFGEASRQIALTAGFYPGHDNKTIFA